MGVEVMHCDPTRLIGRPAGFTDVTSMLKTVFAVSVSDELRLPVTFLVGATLNVAVASPTPARVTVVDAGGSRSVPVILPEVSLTCPLNVPCGMVTDCLSVASVVVAFTLALIRISADAPAGGESAAPTASNPPQSETATDVRTNLGMAPPP